jgi:cytochrome c-type biogenesis protein CcmH
MSLGNGFYFAIGALAAVALLFVLYPWLAGKPRVALLSAVPRWVPIAGVAAMATVLALYIRLGSPQLNDRDASPVSGSSAQGGAVPAGAVAMGAQKQAAGTMDTAVSGLERRLAAGGGSDGDWELLAKSYEFLGRPADAAAARQKRLPAAASSAGAAAASTSAPAVTPLSAEATTLVQAAEAARAKRDFGAARDIYAKLAARNEMNADTWADYADVVGSLNGNSLVGQPAIYLNNALRLNPQHPKALWLMASMLHETHQYQAAVDTWKRLAAVLEPNSDDAKLIAANLAEDQRLAGGGALTPASSAGATSGVSVRGEVVVADALKGKIPAGLTLFIVAKSVNSAGPPVAIIKTSTGSWPLQFQLDDSQAMVPTRKLSTAGAVTIEARTSRTGQAMPAAGDFQGVTPQFNPAVGKPVRVVIQRVIG